MIRLPPLLAVLVFNIKESDVSAISSSIWIELDGLQCPLLDQLDDMDTRSSTDPSGYSHSNLPLTLSPNSDLIDTNANSNQVIRASTRSSLSGSNDSMRIENSSSNGNDNDSNNDKLILRGKKRIGQVGNHSHSHDHNHNHNYNHNHLPTIPNQQHKIIERRGRKGRITCDFGTYSTYPKTTTESSPPPFFETTQLSSDSNEEWGLESNTWPHAAANDYVRENGKVRVSVDPRAVWRFIPVLFFGLYSFLNAFMGTLRLLAPL